MKAKVLRKNKKNFTQQKVDKLKKTLTESLKNFDKAISDDLICKQLEAEGVNLSEHSLKQDKFIKQLTFKLKQKNNKEIPLDILYKK